MYSFRQFAGLRRQVLGPKTRALRPARQCAAAVRAGAEAARPVSACGHRPADAL